MINEINPELRLKKECNICHHQMKKKNVTKRPNPV